MTGAFLAGPAGSETSGHDAPDAHAPAQVEQHAQEPVQEHADTDHADTAPMEPQPMDDWAIAAQMLHVPREGLSDYIDERQVIMEALVAARSRSNAQWGMSAAVTDALLALASETSSMRPAYARVAGSFRHPESCMS